MGLGGLSVGLGAFNHVDKGIGWARATIGLERVWMGSSGMFRQGWDGFIVLDGFERKPQERCRLASIRLPCWSCNLWSRACLSI